MAYRSASASPSDVSRRLRVPDSFRWMKRVLGLLMLGMGLFFLWVGSWSSLACNDEHCVVRREYVLRPTEEFRFDARRPPGVVVEPAKVGKNGHGKRLILRYDNGVDVELARDRGDGVEAKAAGLRAHLGAPRGSFAIDEPHAKFPVAVMFFLAAFGLLMLLDGVGLLGWRRVRADSRRRALVIEHVMLGVPVRRKTFDVTAATSVGSVALSDDNPRVRWLTLDTPGKEPARLPLFDTPVTRADIEEMLPLIVPRPA